MAKHPDEARSSHTLGELNPAMYRFRLVVACRDEPLEPVAERVIVLRDSIWRPRPSAPCPFCGQPLRTPRQYGMTGSPS
jgi:hypothetical protein